MGIDLSALEAVASERKVRGGGETDPEKMKTHITYTVAELDKLRRDLGKPNWPKENIKQLLRDIASGKILLSLAKPKA